MKEEYEKGKRKAHTSKEKEECQHVRQEIKRQTQQERDRRAKKIYKLHIIKEENRKQE